MKGVPTGAREEERERWSCRRSTRKSDGGKVFSPLTPILSTSLNVFRYVDRSPVSVLSLGPGDGGFGPKPVSRATSEDRSESGLYLWTSPGLPLLSSSPLESPHTSNGAVTPSTPRRPT